MTTLIRQTPEQKETVLKEWADLGIADPEEIVSPGSNSPRSWLEPVNRDSADIRAVAKRLKSSLGYGALAEELRLVDILLDADVKIFDSSGVERYMDRVLSAKNRIVMLVNRTLGVMYFGGMILGSLGILTLIALGIWSLFGLAVFPFVWKLLWVVTIVSGVSFATAFYGGDFLINLFDADAAWEWKTVSIMYCDDNIPTPILVKIDEINQLALRKKVSVVFEVHSLRKVKAEVIDDPFISVRLKRSENRFYFGVWSEPSFSGRAYLP